LKRVAVSKGQAKHKQAYSVWPVNYVLKQAAYIFTTLLKTFNFVGVCTKLQNCMEDEEMEGAVHNVEESR
jgi:hypothetical protein